MTRPTYRLVDHTADLAVAVRAPDWPTLLVRAATALGDVIRAADDLGAPERRAVAVEGGDREDVLVAWMTEVLLLFEEDGFLAWEARVEEAGEAFARGTLHGRRLDPRTEPPDRVVKAVTYHDLRVVEGRGGAPWRATVVLDL